MITDKMVEAACAAFCSFQHEKKGVTSIEEFDRADPMLGVAIRKAMRAALEAADRAAWEPIETHPKIDCGPVVIGYDGDDGGGVYNGVVALNYWAADEENNEEWVVNEIGGDCLFGCNITHWRPLPSPPEN